MGAWRAGAALAAVFLGGLAGCKEEQTVQPGKPAAALLSATAAYEQPAPEGFRADVFFGLESVEGLPAQKLADLEVQGPKADLERARASGEDVAPVRQKELQLGANASVAEPLVDVPDKPGVATLKVSLWLVHAGPFPGALVSAKHQKVCLVADVDETGDAYAGGLRKGDVWLQVDELDALAKAQKDPCKALSAAQKAVAVGSKVKFVVLRRGEERVQLELNKATPLLKFMAISVPVLEADKK